MDAKTKWIFSTTLALFLVTGVLGGIILDRLLLIPMHTRHARTASVEDRSQAPLPQTPPPGNEFDPLDRVAQRMTSELSLDEAQQIKIRDILKSHKDKFESLRKEIKTNFDALDLELSKETMEILTDEQKALFKERFVRWPRPASRPPEGPGGRPGPPQEALDACKGKSSADDCSFTDINGDHNGQCGTGARGEFVCMPADAPPPGLEPER